MRVNILPVFLTHIRKPIVPANSLHRGPLGFLSLLLRGHCSRNQERYLGWQRLLHVYRSVLGKDPPIISLPAVLIVRSSLPVLLEGGPFEVGDLTRVCLPSLSTPRRGLLRPGGVLLGAFLVHVHVVLLLLRHGQFPNVRKSHIIILSRPGAPIGARLGPRLPRRARPRVHIALVVHMWSLPPHDLRLRLQRDGDTSSHMVSPPLGESTGDRGKRSG